MKGKACSWRDMRRIKHILENQEELKGEMASLSNCAAKQTRTDWNKIIEVMSTLKRTDLEHTQPTHAREIARHSPKDSWPEWVDSCEKNEWTVAELRSNLMAAKAAETRAAAETSAPAAGKYSTIVVDPPWSYSNKSGRHGDSAKAAYSQNRTLTFDEITLFDVQRWVADNCHLYLWVTDAYLGHVYSVTEAWGFTAKASLIWVKDRIGMGNYYRHQHEVCIFAVKGSMRLSRMDASTVFSAPMTKHSEKPDEFYRLVESCSPGPYLDVFARRKRAGWQVFGDEVATEQPLQLDVRASAQVV